MRRLLGVLQRLVDSGNTMLVIEHNLDVIKSADWIIDLGPEGGAGGGSIVAEGTPEQVAKVRESYTGQFLAPLLGTVAERRRSSCEVAQRPAMQMRGVPPPSPDVAGPAVARAAPMTTSCSVGLEQEREPHERRELGSRNTPSS